MPYPSIYESLIISGTYIGCRSVQDLSFRYSDDGPWILNDMSLFIPAGKCLALIGLNGIGKSTFVKLITRLYDQQKGSIKWDGIDIREFDPIQFREHLGVIFQDFMRYELTVQENIGLGNLQSLNDMNHIKEAAEHAKINEKISQLPSGYQSILSRWMAKNDEGVEFSGGEWQKIALARMFMRNADLWLVDEPTAALDAKAEYDLYRSFTQLFSKKTTVLISHRFSTVRVADLIAVLADGKVVEYGSHNELLDQKGEYEELFRLQTKQNQFSHT
ncbi:MAG: ATP-binding cassette domain-containing protein [Chloroflexi bacterium]|nr:MAG: ATP-binding cassette domain-containing protein [Chloroflexota bacterium]